MRSILIRLGYNEYILNQLSSEDFYMPKKQSKSQMKRDLQRKGQQSAPIHNAVTPSLPQSSAPVVKYKVRRAPTTQTKVISPSPSTKSRLPIKISSRDIGSIADSILEDTSRLDKTRKAELAVAEMNARIAERAANVERAAAERLRQETARKASHTFSQQLHIDQTNAYMQKVAVRKAKDYSYANRTSVVVGRAIKANKKGVIGGVVTLGIGAYAVPKMFGNPKPRHQ